MIAAGVVEDMYGNVGLTLIKVENSLLDELTAPDRIGGTLPAGGTLLSESRW